MLRVIKAALIAAIIVILLIFCVTNREFVTVRFFPLSYEIALPEFLFALLCIALGVTVGSFAVHLKLLKVKRELKLKHQHIMALENEMQALHVQQAKGLP